MKFRVIFLKRKYIYFLALTLSILILFIIFMISRDSSPTFNNISRDKKIKADFDGDGKDDMLSVKKEGDKYLMEIKTKDTVFKLNTDNNSSTVGYHSPYWPLRVTLMDVSRDKIPEIFIQGCKGGNPLQRVFIFNNNKFDNIFSSSNNILGFIDCKNNKTPKVISGKLQGDNISLSNYIFLNYKFKNYNYESTKTFMGKDTICTFIKLIQGLPHSEAYKPSDIFSQHLAAADMALIGKLSGENNSYVFQDGIFMENRCDKSGDVTEVSWSLNFRGVSNNDSSLVKNYTINLTLTPVENSKEDYHFKISSMYLK